ncbi:Alpha/Beta hydrolase protein [Exophiala viscosa]|uniref:Alpha/Beta hydrolase protein n=1 Tax=Exophiala viscosa TaxID=2486360 RepID=A0AAN6DT82_9EURO|nr:Alpha/Beta hydrolase protein [Exophiala viscosa]KAI1623463.1 Alpha/Beta hydrolase protein [Exophiala viscosa]
MSGTSTPFSSLTESAVSDIETTISDDAQYRACSVGISLCFRISSHDQDDQIVYDIKEDAIKVYLRCPQTLEPRFTLHAKSEHWDLFFAAQPKRPFQSYWGMLRILGQESGVEVTGDFASFLTYALLWRTILDRTRDQIQSHIASASDQSYASDDELDDDSIIGHYTWIKLSRLGKCKIFYETSGRGDQQILFLHTAGADSRQFHSMMMNRKLQEMCTMYAFDLPGHGRSFPGSTQYPWSYANSEELYVSAIAQIIAKLDLKRVIVSGASMGGQVCLAVALRAEELNVSGVIPCEACDYLPKQRAQTIYGLAGDESVLNPERVCGMISPTSPEIYKRLNWWIYSAQATSMFPSDLLFYFEGWDGRDRMAQIDTEVCPVYMLTGEYDYSCTPDASRATAAKIKGAVFEEMKRMGHFPFSENPSAFLPYFLRALEHVVSRQRLDTKPH